LFEATQIAETQGTKDGSVKFQVMITLRNSFQHSNAELKIHMLLHA